MERLKKILFSTRTMTILLLIFGLSMAVATFVENDFDTATAKVLIYNSTWFEILMLWLILVFVANIKRYGLTQKKKWPVLIFHLAFIAMFIGGAITRYVSFEGQMPIKEGQTTNEIISDLTYIKMSVKEGRQQRIYDRYPYTMSYFNAKDTKWPFKRTFRQDYQFGDKVISLKSLDYIPMARDSVQENESGKKMLTIVTVGQNGRENNYITEGEIKNINGVVFSFNFPMQGAVQLKENAIGITVVFPSDGRFLSMEGQQTGVVVDTALLAKNSGIFKANETRPLEHRTLYTVNGSNFIVPERPYRGNIVYYSGDKNDPGDKNLLEMVEMEVSSGTEKDTVMIKGGKGITEYSKTLTINGMNVSLGFGSKVLHTDFLLRCDNFLLDRYPGSDNPSSYESKLTVIDGGKQEQHKVFMNNVLDYKGYRFFQASYFPDESGTILSVNADRWGTDITYFGYFLLFAGMFLTLFWKGTRFWKLNEGLKKIHTKNIVLPLLFVIATGLATTGSYAQETALMASGAATVVERERDFKTQFAAPLELGANRMIDRVHAKKFGHLLVQDFQGRVKPMDTYTLELLRKIYKKDKYKMEEVNITPEQWFISMQVDPWYWSNQNIIWVGHKGGEELRRATGANAAGYTTYADLVDLATGSFKLKDRVNASFSKRKADQSNYDKALIELTERFNIFSNIAYGYYTRLIPVKNDPAQIWRSWIYSSDGNPAAVDTQAYRLMTGYFDGVKKGLKSGDWGSADSGITAIDNFQQIWGKAIIPPPAKVNLEILYNHLNVFFWLMIVYSLLGASLTGLGFGEVLSDRTKYNRVIKRATKALLAVMVAAITVQAIALGVRWYLSGHAPWSNGYEAIVFISGIGVLAGLLLYKNRNAFIPAAGALVAMIMMGFAHGGSLLDPQITQLEPVLKSYWLMIHVGIITSSYGFFGLSAVLSAISLMLYTARPTQKISRAINELTIVNEMALTIGIFALTIGTFMGGIWANESWGRYWSWDPKETWAFISIIFYAVILHLRLVPQLRNSLTFNIASLWGIWSIIFTYFGVNYYLSGLHSYAAGDPMPVPSWIYIAAAGMLVLALTAWLRAKGRKAQEPVDRLHVKAKK